MKQRTLKKSVRIEGIGIHTGEKSSLFLHPAPSDSGVSFLKKGTEIKADLKFTEANQGHTVLSRDGMRIHTVEHLLASLYGMGVDNCMCEISGDEIPALDGSAIGFVESIKDAGVIQLDNERKIMTLESSLRYREEERDIIALPSPDLYLAFYIDYGRPYPPPQYRRFKITPEIFEKEIAPARTYCFSSWIENIRNRGQGMGGSPDNVIVIGDNGPSVRLRFPDEFVRHKILDFIGDLSLLGYYLAGSILAFKSGHIANVKFTKLLKNQLDKVL